MIDHSTPALPALGTIPAWARRRNQPATYPRAFVDVAAARGIEPARVLARAGVPDDWLSDPAARLSLLELLQVVDSAIALTGDLSIGFETGRRLPLTAHGSLGYALMCAATPREAIGILERFWHLRGRGVVLDVEIGDGTLLFALSPELQTREPLRHVLMSSMLTSMYLGVRFVVPQTGIRSEIWLDGPEPPGFDAAQAQLDVRFTMPRNGIHLTGDLAMLDMASPTANPEALAQAIAQCERESALTDPGSDVVRRVRAALVPGNGGYPTPERLAAMLHMTPRTFRRRLQEQGQSYQQLLEEARRRDSIRLLQDPALPIRHISEMLGYADPANFTRAFRNWMGVAPAGWRDTQQK